MEGYVYVYIASSVVIGVIIALIVKKIGVSEDTIIRWVPGTVVFIGGIAYGLYIHGPLHMVLLIAIAGLIYVQILVSARFRYQADKKRRKEEQEKKDKNGLD